MRTILRKWYFDLLTPDDVFVFVYFAHLRLLGQTIRSVMLHCAMPGRLPQTLAFTESEHREDSTAGGSGRSIRFPDGSIDLAGDECRLLFARDLCRIDLQFVGGEPFGGSPLEIMGPGGGHILWMPLSVKYRVSGEVNIGTDVLTVGDATGYADTMESTISPWRIPVRALHWGRIHHREIDLVYAHCHGETEDWSRIYLRRSSHLMELHATSLVESPLPGESFALEAEEGPVQLRLHVHHLCPVQQDGMIDKSAIRSGFARSMLGAFSRDLRSTKYLSHGDISLETSEGLAEWSTLDMIDEVVHLGHPWPRFHLRRDRREHFSKTFAG